MRRIDRVYGKYATPALVAQMMEAAKMNAEALKLNRNDLAEDSSSSSQLNECCADLSFWNNLIAECRVWERYND